MCQIKQVNAGKVSKKKKLNPKHIIETKYHLQMFSWTVEGIFFDTKDIRGVLYVPVPFKPAITAPASVDNCMVEYWVPCIRHEGRAHELNLYRKTITAVCINDGSRARVIWIEQINDLAKFCQILCDMLKFWLSTAICDS